MPSQVRHVWCQSGGKPADPGLLIAWEQHGAVRWAWVMVVIDRPGRSTAVIQRWMCSRTRCRGAPSRPILARPKPVASGLVDDYHRAGIVGMSGNQPVTMRARVRTATMSRRRVRLAPHLPL